MDAQQEAETRRVVRSSLLEFDDQTSAMFKSIRARAIIELYLYAFEVDGIGTRLMDTAFNELVKLDNKLED